MKQLLRTCRSVALVLVAAALTDPIEPEGGTGSP